MSGSSCLLDCEEHTDVQLTQEEMVTLFLNMIAFKGDWNKHLDFLSDLEGDHLWKHDQIPLVRSMRYRDLEHNIQETVTSEL